MTKAKSKSAKKGNVTSAIVPRPPASLLFSLQTTQPHIIPPPSAKVANMPASSNTPYSDNPPYSSSQYVSSADTPFPGVEDPRGRAANTRYYAAHLPPPPNFAQDSHPSSDYRADQHARVPYPRAPPPPPVSINARGPHPPYGYASSGYDPSLHTSNRYSLPQDYDVASQSYWMRTQAPQSYVSQSYAPRGPVSQSFPAEAYPSSTYLPSDYLPPTYLPQNYAAQSQNENPQPQSSIPQTYAPSSSTSYNLPPHASVEGSHINPQTPQQPQQSRYNLRSKTGPPASKPQRQVPSPVRTRAQSYTPSAAPEPSMTAQYVQLANKACLRLKQPQPLLVISDLNGTLLYRKKAGTTSYKPRPGLDDFLRYVFMTRSPKFTLPSRDAGTIHPMIWTSAQPETCQALVKSLLSPKHKEDCVAIWARDTLRLTPSQYRNKTQVYKRLEWIWSDESIQKTHPHKNKGAKWDQTNTLLIDDSIVKALAQPYNLINLPEFDEAAVIAEARLSDEEAVLAQVVAYIDEARWWSNVSTYVKGRPFKIGQWIVDAPGNRPQEGVRLNFVDLTLEG